MLLALLSFLPAASASHIPGQPCSDCASHKHWPTISGIIKKANDGRSSRRGTARSDELLGHHGSDSAQRPRRLGHPVGRLAGPGQHVEPERPDLRRRRQRLHLRLARPQRHLRRPGQRRDLRPLRPRRRRLRPGARHLPRRQVAQEGRTSVKNCEKVDRRSERQRGGGLSRCPNAAAAALARLGLDERLDRLQDLVLVQRLVERVGGGVLPASRRMAARGAPRPGRSSRPRRAPPCDLIAGAAPL